MGAKRVGYIIPPPKIRIDPVDSIFLNILLFKCTVLSSSVLYCQRFQILLRLVQAEKKVNHLLATLQNEGPI